MHYMHDTQTGNYLPLTPKGYVSRRAIGCHVTLYHGARATITGVRGKRITFDTRMGEVTGALGYILAVHGK